MRLRYFIGFVLLVAGVGAAVGSLEGVSSRALFFETFEDGWEDRWIPSKHSKYDGQFVEFTPEHWKDPGLKIPEKSKHYGMTALLPHPVDPTDGIVVQYEVKYSQTYNCGGSYVKLLTHVDGFKAEDLVDTSPYSIMFGPDKCGGPSGKIHLILRHKNPLNGTISEKHLKTPPTPITDAKTHVYTLALNANNKYEILIDGESKASGSIFEDFEPPINPPQDIPDPTDVKPKDWADDAKIPDPSATKPENWDDREQIPDEAASKPYGWLDDEPPMVPDHTIKKPSDWDDEEDGEWSAPMIKNPKCNVGCGEWKRPTKKNVNYKGRWNPPMIDNPAYKGPWVQKTIPNPDHYYDGEPLANIGKIGAIAFELWTIDEGYIFDNVLVAETVDVAADARAHGWKDKADAEKAAQEEEDRLKREKRKNAKKQSFADALVSVLDKLTPEIARPYLQPALDFLYKYPYIALGASCSPLLVLLVIVIMGYRSAGRDEVGQAKKEDLTGPDDDQEDDAPQATPLQEGASEAQAGPSGVQAAAKEVTKATKAATSAAKEKVKLAEKAKDEISAAAQEVEEEEGEEEEVVEKKKGPVRRRA